MSTIASHNIDHASAAAPFLLGALFNWALFGVLSVQVYFYYLSFPRDKWTIKSLVYIVYLVDTAQTCLVTHDIFDAYAKHYGSFDVLNSVQLSPISVPLCSSIVSATVQLYYAHRIGILFRSRWFRALVSLLALVANIGGLVAAYQALSASGSSVLVRKKYISTGIWLVGDAACDIVITVLMAYLLLKHNGKSSQTHAIVQRLIRLVVETNMLTAIAASAGITLYYVYPHAVYHRCPSTILTKLYSNSMLAVFNSRIRIAGGRDWVSDSNITSMDTRGGHFSTVGPVFFICSVEAATSSSDSVIHTEEETWKGKDRSDVQPSDSIEKRQNPAVEAV